MLAELRTARLARSPARFPQALAKVRAPTLLIVGGVFVWEAVSVIIQVGWFKLTRARSATGEGKRFFLMAPIHHHFEKKGWYESQVVMRFYILGVLCAVVALSTLKLR